MEFRRGQLLYFVTVAEEGQITRAAERLHIAQPALSQAISQLEEDLGLTLLERHARGVTLTPNGEAFLAKARVALSAWQETFALAESSGRIPQGRLDFGFFGAPPSLDSPVLLRRFGDMYPGIDIRYRELSFPSLPVRSWLAEVDVAVCHRLPADPDVWTHLVRREPRVLMMSAEHPLASRGEVAVAEVLDETFVSLHPSVAPSWAHFWTLDDHRGGPPARLTDDRVSTPQEVLASLAVRSVVTVVPASVGRIVSGTLPSIATVLLRDAAPAEIQLVGHRGRSNACVEALREFARSASAGMLAVGPAEAS